MGAPSKNIRMPILYSQCPALAILPSDELVGFVEVGDLHVHCIPKQFLAAGEFAAGILDIIATQGQVAHQDRFGQRTGVFEWRAKLVLAITCDTGVHPLYVMSFR